MVKIRLMRVGKKKQPYYRVVVADARSPRDGRFIENIGRYHPRQHPSLIEIDSERALHWLKNGAQPSDPVRVLLQKTGVWGQFTGEGPTEPVEPPADEARPSKKAAAAAAESSAASEAPAAEAAPEPAAEAAPEPAAEPTPEPAAEDAVPAEPEASEPEPGADAAQEAPPAEQPDAPEAESEGSKEGGE